MKVAKENNYPYKEISMRKIICFITLSFTINLFGQNNVDLNRHIDFPNVKGFVTMVCDFHTHSVFSDGSVWPDIRIQEAQKDGLDAIAITEHLEYQPHKDDIPHPDRNRSYQLAKGYSGDSDLLVINGTEITKSMPPGHSNAIFINDANTILNEDYLKSFIEAKKQGAFIFWNHPFWIGQSKDGLINLSKIHQDLIDKKMLHGIEVTNDLTYSDEAIQIAIDNNLTFIGTSDVHGLVDWQYKIPQGGHRPVTLVLAKNRTAKELKKALFAGRTIVWYNNLLIGLEKWVKPLIESSMFVESSGYYRKTHVAVVDIRNNSDARFILKNTSPLTFYTNSDIIEIQPNSVKQIGVKTGEKLSKFELTFEVLNSVIGPKKHPEIKFVIKGANNNTIQDVTF